MQASQPNPSISAVVLIPLETEKSTFTIVLLSMMRDITMIFQPSYGMRIVMLSRTEPADIFLRFFIGLLCVKSLWSIILFHYSVNKISIAKIFAVEVGVGPAVLAWFLMFAG